MKKNVIALFTGCLFGAGLAFSQMLNPAKVIGFLNLFGEWDPSLALVMGGALMVTIPGFRWVLKQPRPLLGEKYQVPNRTTLDGRLLTGAVLFGIGWGLGGICPGPALAGMALGLGKIFVFLASLIVGMFIFQFTLGKS